MELAELFDIPIETLFRGFFLPFVLIFTIFWAILSSLGVFNKKINFILSLAFSLLVATTPQFTMLTTYIAQLSGEVAIVAFGLLFGFGALLWAIGRGRDIYDESGSYHRRLIKLEEKENNLMNKYNRTTDPNKKDVIWKQIERIRREKRSIEAAMSKRRF